MKHFSSLWILIIGLFIVFFWFGVDKFLHPIYWTGWIPNFFEGFLGFEKMSWNSFFGVIEIIMAALLLFNKTRWMGAILISGYLLPIIFFNWPSDIAFRDIGLFASSLYLFFISKPKSVLP